MRVALEPPPGLASDDTTFASKGAYADGSNVRFWLGKPQVIGGWSGAFVGALTGVCRNLKPWTTVSQGITVAFGTHSALMVYVSGVLSDITPSGLTVGSIDAAGTAPGWGSGGFGSGLYSTPNSIFYPRTWSLDTFGSYLVAVPRGGTLYQWQNNPVVDAVAVTNAPIEITAMLVTPQRQVLAIGCNEQGGATPFNGLCVRGCAIEDLTAWASTSTNTAFQDLLEGGGRLVTGVMVGDYVALLSDNALYVGEYQGNPLQMYRWEMVEGNCGIIGPNAKVVYKGVLYWVAPDGQFRMWAPGGKPQIVPCPIWRDFVDNCDVSQGAKITAATISQYDEIWFFYPDLRDDSNAAENSRYVALSLAEVATGAFRWFRGQMARTAFCDAGVQTYPMGVDPSGTVFNHESGRDADGDPLGWYIQTADQYLDDAQRCLQLQGVWPDFENQEGDVSLTIYVRQFPQGSAITKGPYTLPAGGRKKDFRADGRIAAIRIEGTAAPTYMRVGKPSFEAIVTGQR